MEQLSRVFPPFSVCQPSQDALSPIGLSPSIAIATLHRLRRRAIVRSFYSSLRRITLRIFTLTVYLISVLPDSLALQLSASETMVRVTPLASAALLSFAAIEGVIAGSQPHLRDSSSFLATCKRIATSISNASVVNYPRQSSITAPCSS